MLLIALVLNWLLLGVEVVLEVLQSLYDSGVIRLESQSTRKTYLQVSACLLYLTVTSYSASHQPDQSLPSVPPSSFSISAYPQTDHFPFLLVQVL